MGVRTVPPAGTAEKRGRPAANHNTTPHINTHTHTHTQTHTWECSLGMLLPSLWGGGKAKAAVQPCAERVRGCWEETVQMWASAWVVGTCLAGRPSEKQDTCWARWMWGI
eukprot:GGOE01030971.1.p7 GENE.GGOE01030971.1~~GGOE01030971.1.p7  ORF type:complete len:110 (+),score=2.58 GGOE01030971.1:716-1045(+)